MKACQHWDSPGNMSAHHTRAALHLFVFTFLSAGWLDYLGTTCTFFTFFGFYMLPWCDILWTHLLFGYKQSLSLDNTTCVRNHLQPANLWTDSCPMDSAPSAGFAQEWPREVRKASSGTKTQAWGPRWFSRQMEGTRAHWLTQNEFARVPPLCSPPTSITWEHMTDSSDPAATLTSVKQVH